jgi:hypothetical protein
MRRRRKEEPPALGDAGGYGRAGSLGGKTPDASIAYPKRDDSFSVADPMGPYLYGGIRRWAVTRSPSSISILRASRENSRSLT